MSMAWVREQYGVPAKRGARVAFEGSLGTIISTRGPHLRIRLDCGEVIYAHPTWHINYAPVLAGSDTEDREGQP